jgi:hypothetical protein
MPFIRESIITTRNEDGSAHIAPMGIHELDEGQLLIAPFRPSTTLTNLNREQAAVINYTDDVRIFAGCVTGRYQWPVTDAEVITAPRLQNCLAHSEVKVARFEDDEQRPKFICHVEHEVNHVPFHGFNRAQIAVIEAAILVTRLSMLPTEKINQEIDYLKIAIDKTAGSREQEAWGWLMITINDFHNRS